MIVVYVILALLMLGMMVLIHEAGHFWASRMTGIPVKEFGIGFGPKLTSKKSKKYDTLFVLRAIPAGGYCMYYGEDDPSSDQSDPRSLYRQNVWKRMFAIVMGPMMNFISAFLVCVIFLLCLGRISYGEPDMTKPCVIISVDEGSPAAKAGLLPEDQILRIDGIDAVGYGTESGYRTSELFSSYTGGEEGVAVTVMRNGEEALLRVYPRLDPAEGVYHVGISYAPQAKIEQINSLGSLFQNSFRYMIDTGGTILKGLGSLFSSWNSFTSNASGPIGIVSTVAEATRDYGITAYVELLIIISVNLGLFNLIPIPGLDGSRVVFLLVEAIRGKPVNQKIEAIIHLCGYVLLFGLIILCSCQDVIRLF